MAEADHDDALSPEEERCLDALRMVEQGMSRKDVAAHYGKAPRTVFDWINRAQRIRRERLNGLLPADVLANAHARYEAKSLVLEQQFEAAQAAGSTSLMLELSREIRGWQRQHLEMLRLTGFFRAYLHPAVPHSAREAAVQSIVGDFQAVLTHEHSAIPKALDRGCLILPRAADLAEMPSITALLTRHCNALQLF